MQVAGLNGEVDAMEAWLNSSDKCVAVSDAIRSYTCANRVSRLVSATKARVARLETVVSNISLAKLIERVMQVRVMMHSFCLRFLVIKTAASPCPIPRLFRLRCFSVWNGNKRH